jgi:carboxyl-terminal processing protease
VAEKMEQIRKRIIGPAGTSVTLTIRRAGWSAPKDFIITRGKIQIKNVEWKIIESGGKKFGYLKIDSFMPDTTAKEVAKAVKEFKGQKVEGAIIDLRNNPGGRLDYCVDVLANFLPPDSLVVSTKGRVGEEKYYTDDSYTGYFAAPLVVLINDGSASASEIVAGALRDYKKAVLVGKKTYGKGSVQIVHNFPDGSQLNLTAFKYFLPSGECIHEKGISPNIEAETEFDESIVSKALNVLKNWKTYKDKFLK